MAKTYLNNGGNHVDLDFVCNTGETVTTDIPLDKKYEAKFTVVATKQTETAPAPKSKAKAKADKDEAEDKKNVTKDFKNANEEVIVLKDSKGWHVYDADDLKEPINATPLFKKDVEAFLADYLKEED